MKEQYTDSFIETLYNTHKAEWEATPSNQQAVEWLCELIEFLFPNNRLNKHSTYEGRLKKNQIDLENILLSYLDPQNTDIALAVSSFYASLEEIYQNLRHDATKIYEHDPAATSI